MRASSPNLSHTTKPTDRVIQSYDGFSSYLMIVDEASRFVWIFLTRSKEPPLDIISEFLRQHGHEGVGCIRTNQGGKLARSHKFKDSMLRDFHYAIEPTGADSPSQNGAVEIYNNKFGVRTRALLYGSGLPAKFWSTALLHSVYLHNRLIHLATKITPFKSYYGFKPDLSGLKSLGPVCVSDVVASAEQSLTDMTSPESSLATRPQIKTSSTSIWTAVLLRLATMLNSTRPGTYSKQGRQRAQLLDDIGLEYTDVDTADMPLNTLSENPSCSPPWPPIHPAIHPNWKYPHHA